MGLGPVEYIAIAFPGNQFSGEILPALADLVDSGTIRILDLVFVTKDADGRVDSAELSEANDTERAGFEQLGVQVGHLFNADDISAIGSALDPNSSAALMLWENVWGARFAEALRNANGELVANGRIPVPVVEEAMAQIAALD